MNNRDIAKQLADDHESPIEITEHLTQKIVDEVIDITDSYNKMMEFNPDLNEHITKDRKLFLQYFIDLWNLHPTHAKSPVVAGVLMRQMSASPKTAGTVLLRVNHALHRAVREHERI